MNALPQAELAAMSELCLNVKYYKNKGKWYRLSISSPVVMESNGKLRLVNDNKVQIYKDEVPYKGY